MEDEPKLLLAVPKAQLMQESIVCPVSPLYLPLAQFVQTALSKGAILYFPTPQPVQAPVAGVPVWPALHRQFVTTSEPVTALELELPGHAVQEL